MARTGRGRRRELMAPGRGWFPVTAYGDDDAHDLRRNQSRDSCRRLPVHVRVALDPIGPAKQKPAGEHDLGAGGIEKQEPVR